MNPHLRIITDLCFAISALTNEKLRYHNKKGSGLGTLGDLYRLRVFKITGAYAKEQSRGDGLK
jgi:hypothetical protein